MRHTFLSYCKSVLLLITLTAFISSCDKEEDKPSLAGTVWEKTANGHVTLSFEENLAKVEQDQKYFSSPSITLYTYKYNHPKVTLIPTDDNLVELDCEIKDNIMYVYNPTITYGDQLIWTLYKH